MKCAIQVLMLVSGLVTLTEQARSCTLPVGYFNRVRMLRGTVVGVNDGDLRHPFRWLRQRVVRPNVRLTLYEYRSPSASASERPIVKVVKSGPKGEFDFGAIGTGHYTLEILDPWSGYSTFDIEIVSFPNTADAARIDISPVYPNCQGGHEFIPVYP